VTDVSDVEVYRPACERTLVALNANGDAAVIGSFSNR
jgi:hypothetical protein